VIGRVAGWLRRSWSVVTDVHIHGAAESQALVQAFVVAAVAQARLARCAQHPDRPAVVTLVLADGTRVGQCSVCALVRTGAELVGAAGVAVAS
jgi:hypothetical protein